MLKNLIFIFLISLLVIASCNITDKAGADESPVARVYNRHLYPSDVALQMPNGVTGVDSLRIARRITEEWVKDKLLLRKAEQFLEGTDYNIERQLEDYRASLLIFRYKQEVLLQRLDTLITENEILEYYTENPSNYLLNTDVVRLTYVKVPLNTPQLSVLRNLYRSVEDESLAQLEQYCMEHAVEYIINSDEWYRFIEFMNRVPVTIDNPGRYLRFNRNIEARDSEFRYFVHIIDHVPEKETAPLRMVADEIRNVLINKRKITLIQELESSVYKEGMSRNLAEIYN